MYQMTDTLFSDITGRLRLEGNHRRIPSATRSVDVIDLSSNDYLGLASRTDLQEEFFSRPGATRLPMTSSASRLLASAQDEYLQLENLLASLYGREALLFNSGYHANSGIIPAIASAARTLIIADKLAHASIIDGMTLSGTRFTRFRHNDIAHLRRIIEKESDGFDQILVIAESIYSMDGDSADIEGLAAVKMDFPKVTLYIDEAHAVGAVGDRGLGLCRGADRYDAVDIVIGTFGKACASMGAFCVVSPAIKDFLVNRARSLIFSTAIPPVTVAWTRFVLEHTVTMDREREHLKSLGQRLNSFIKPLSPHFPVSPGHIQPLVTGNPKDAVEISAKLLEHGFKVLPIRVPTVPPGTDRLRISLSAALSGDDIDNFGHALNSIMSAR